MNRQDILHFFAKILADGAAGWGIGVSDAGGLRRAAMSGASWAVVNHLGGMPSTLPASVLGLLPYADANAVVLELGGLTGAPAMPAFAAVFAADQFRITASLLGRIAELGYGGVQNFPSVGLAGGKFTTSLRDAHMDYACEVEMIRQAAKMSLFTSALVFDYEQAEAMLAAGADMLVFHPGLNADGEFRDYSHGVRKRFAAICEMTEKIRGYGRLVARLHFEPERGPVPDPDGILIQYDQNILPGAPHRIVHSQH